MPITLNIVRKIVSFSLVGLGIFSGVSIGLETGIDAQELNRPEKMKPSEAGNTPLYSVLSYAGKDLASIAEIIPEISSEMALSWLEAILEIDSLGEPEVILEIETVKPGQSNRSAVGIKPSIVTSSGSKTIAIDAGPDNGDMPAITEMDPVHFAAQMWSNASFPVEHFQAYTSPFGYRSSPSGGYRQEFHYGLDIAAPNASYIRNWWAGTVIEVSDGGGCGTSVVIQSGEWTHMYCHMQGYVQMDRGVPSLIDRDGGVQLWEGQQIVAGDRIGRVGMTGRTTGPHLHWGLKYQGNWVDPAWVIQAMAASYQALYGQN